MMNNKYLNKCRLCLGGGLMLNIFENQNSVTMCAKIKSLAKIEIYPEDGLPQSICNKCFKKINICMDFIQLCQESDFKLRSQTAKDNIIALDNIIAVEIESSPKSDSFKELSIDETVSILPEEELEKNDDYDKNLKSMHKKETERQQCFTCGKVMSSRFRLKTHMRTHTKERPFTCQYCKKNFSLPENLKVHLRTHTGEKPFSCTQCGETFAHTAGLAAHKRKHTGQLPYKCVLCSRSFRTIGHLQYHTRGHTGEKKFECETCNRAFITRSDLKKHCLSHTGDKAHVCCICGLRLSRGSHLKRHIQFIHNTEKPFACSLCPNKFSQKSDLEKHKTKHKDEKRETKLSA